MHVAVENECEKSNGESDTNADKLAPEVEADTREEIFTNINGIKAVAEEENDKQETIAEKEPEISEKLTLSNGVSHDVNDVIEEEDVEESQPQAEQKSPEPEPEPKPSQDEEKEKPTEETTEMEIELTPEEPVKVSEEKLEGKENVQEEKPAEEIVEKIEQPVEKKPERKTEEKEVEPVQEEKMDTSEAETVIKPEESIKPEETKVEPETSPEPKPTEDKEREAESKKPKLSEDSASSDTKVEKKASEPEKVEKESTPKESPPVAASAVGVKRKAENGEEAEPDRDGGISSSSSSSCGEADNAQDCKRIRFDESIFEEDERERLIREFVERSTDSSEEIGKNCDKLQHEIAALSDLARAKELEWNSIMRLLKLKEEMLERILFKKRHIDCQNKPELDANLNKMYKNFVTSSTASVEQNKTNRSETNTPTSVSNHVTVVPVGSSAATTNGVSNSTSQEPFSGKSSNNTVLATEGVGKLRPHRPILPKPPVSSGQAVQPSSHVPHTPHTQPQPQQLQPHSSQPPQPNVLQSTSLLVDQNSIIGEGRQGPILDVKSIIADFRSKNPDSLPRRGRRNLPFGSRIPDGGPPRFLANTSLMSMANMALGSGSHVRTSVTSTTHNDHRPNSFMIGQDNAVPTSLTRTEMQMRHPTIDSLMLQVNAAASGNSSQPNSSTSSSNSSNNSFQEALVKFAKMNEKRDISSNAALHLGGNKGGSHLPPPPPYPEVTLHPVLVPQSSGSPPVQNSLLHGILTKSNAAVANQHHPSSTVGNAAGMNATSVGNIQHRPTTFSPTLARLLTAPERNRVNRSAVGSSSRSTKSTLNEILNSKKTRTEVTITPVTTSTTCPTKNGSDVVLDDDDESEAADRLVIDEGREVVAESASNVIPADQVPECQGCHKKAAQFVCAGCGNQWYCSRECQVQAWEDHSEMCSG